MKLRRVDCAEATRGATMEDRRQPAPDPTEDPQKRSEGHADAAWEYVNHGHSTISEQERYVFAEPEDIGDATVHALLAIHAQLEQIAMYLGARP